MKAATQATKQSDIQREWHLIDVNDETLGRVSTKIAGLLMGKGKSYFVRNLDCGDHVVIVNAKQIKVTGKKEDLKKYYRHSGYPGGFKEETLKEMRQKHPEDILRHAVKGMLPQNRLRDRMLKRLHVFAEATHTYQDKFVSGKSEAESKEV